MKTDYRNNVDSDVSGPHFDDCENDDAVMDDKSKISSEKTLKTCMDKTEEMIESLRTTADVKSNLSRIWAMANSGNEVVRHCIKSKNLFVISPLCKELSDIGRVYAHVIKESHLHEHVIDNRGYIELAYPASDAENFKNEMHEFLDSVQIAGGRHKFEGVFLISFENYKRGEELIRTSHFAELLRFINNNKSHISFVFHVTPGFRNAEMLIDKLSECLNLILLEHVPPRIQEAADYVYERLKDTGMELGDSVRKGIYDLVTHKAAEADDYSGYDSLDRIVTELTYELFGSESDDEKLAKVVKHFSKMSEKTEPVRLGFCS